MVCEKSFEEKQKNNLLDLIKFQNQPHKPVVAEVSEFLTSTNNDFFNYFQLNHSFEKLDTSSSYVVIYKIKDIILKLYPQLAIANRTGYSLKKIMAKYDLNNLPNFEKSKIILKKCF